MTEWTVTITAQLNYNTEDHGDFIASAEDARQDAIDWLASMGATPGAFEVEVREDTEIEGAPF